MYAFFSLLFSSLLIFFNCTSLKTAVKENNNDVRDFCDSLSEYDFNNTNEDIFIDICNRCNFQLYYFIASHKYYKAVQQLQYLKWDHKLFQGYSIEQQKVIYDFTYEIFLKAIQENDTFTIDKLVNAVELHRKDNNGNNSLHLAVLYNNVYAFKQIIQKIDIEQDLKNNNNTAPGDLLLKLANTNKDLLPMIESFHSFVTNDYNFSQELIYYKDLLKIECVSKTILCSFYKGKVTKMKQELIQEEKERKQQEEYNRTRNQYWVLCARGNVIVFDKAYGGDSRKCYIQSQIAITKDPMGYATGQFRCACEYTKKTW